MIALIDGDGLVYQSATARPPPEQGAEYTKREDAAYLMKCWENFQFNLQKMLDTLYCTEYLMAVKGKDNYRDAIYPLYKLNRSKADRRFVSAMRELAVFEGLAIESHGREADDLIRIWAVQAAKEGDPYIVCTADKDLQCIPGLFYDIRKKSTFKVTPEDARRHYFEQLLKGDSVDNIPGLPGIGPKTASKILQNCNTLEEYQEAVVDAYIRAYGDAWREYLLSNGKLIHIQQTPDDYFILDWPIAKELS